MQTQGISLNASAMQSMSSGKSTKVNDATFDRFMSQSTSGASKEKANQSVDRQKDIPVRDAKSDVRSSSEEYNRNKISLTSQNQKKDEWVDVTDMEEIGEQVVGLLKKTFGLSEEDILDIMELLGVTPEQMAFCMSPENQTITPVNVELVQSFVMEMHGVEDVNLFLTSDQLSGELDDIMAGIEDILSSEMGKELTDALRQGDQVLMQSFAESMAKAYQQGDETTQDAVVDESGQDESQLLMAEGTEDEIQVVVEMSDDSGMSETSTDSGQTLAQEIRDTQQESPLNAFVDRLSRSVENVRQDTVTETRTTMGNIVEQVVNHVRIRVLPQTTSMELQLNPESLGRVNLNVTSQNGTATATLTVQNQVAKEALESQIQVLRENLENQGLKVDAVEVNVSEFGFKNPEDSNSKQNPHKKTAGKAFRFDAGSEMDEIQEEDMRQETNSVVDFTA